MQVVLKTTTTALILTVVLAGCAGGPEDAATRDGPLLNLHVGDSYTYRWESAGSSTTAVSRLGAPLSVLDASGSRVLAVPLVTDGMDSTTFVPLLGIADGAEVVTASGCLVLRMPCTGAALLMWPACPLAGSFFAPFASMDRSAVDGSEVVVREPNRGYEWKYRVDRDGSVVRLALDPQAMSWDRCQLPSAAKIDLDRGLLLEIESARTKGVLLEYLVGNSGVIGSGDKSPSASALPPLPVIDALPPGAAGAKSGDFPLGEAWSVAKRDSEDVREFLEQHPGTVVAGALRSRGKVELLGMQTAQTAGWAVTLLAPTGETRAVQIVKTRSPPWPDEYRFVPDDPQRSDDFPARFDRVEELRDFGQAIEWLTRTIGPPSSQPNFVINAVPGAASYEYEFEFDGGPGGISGWVLYDAGTGRLVQVNVDSGTPSMIITRR